MNIAANVLLASGASPAMLHTPEESEEFAAIAGALTVNLGTLSPNWVDGAHKAIDGAQGAGKPWVLDPVAHYASAWRAGVTRALVERRPTILRGNASEILAIAGLGGAARGVDAGDSVDAAEDAARALAGHTGGIVAISGPFDFVTDGTRAARVANGHPMMGRITVMGCSLNGVIAAFCAGQPGFEATVAALAAYGVAGEAAGRKAQGPGSFQVAFLDALHDLTPEVLDAAARIEVVA
jgi:hydroxyethylthiazole kinase